jgi:hypothetical protein
MEVQHLNVSQQQAFAALKVYKEHRNVYDKRDWEIERIYRAIAKGKMVISVVDAIRRGGLDALGRPKLAVSRADEPSVRCDVMTNSMVRFLPRSANRWIIEVPWPGIQQPQRAGWWMHAQIPRVPPQFRPPEKALKSYHILWEADWVELPRDPMLLKRIGKDAWVVLAAWDLTDVEISVLRAHQTQ